MLLAGALAACVAPVPVAAEDDPVWSVADLWTGAAGPGVVTVGPVVVTSPRTEGGGAFFVQDPGGGPESGLRIDLGGFLASLPPPIGSEVEVHGAWSRGTDGVLALVLQEEDDLTDLGTAASAEPSPAGDDPLLAGALVSASDVGISSDVDPAGRADTDAGFTFDGRFGIDPPGFGSRGDARGIVVTPGSVALRSDADWTGTAAAGDPIDTTIAEVRAGAWPDGTPVRVEGVQLAPWGPDGRWTAIQDGADGLWIDAEGWGIAGDTSTGDRLAITGEVRTDAEGVRLRCWTVPVRLGSGTPVTSAEAVDGAEITVTVTDPGPADAWGDRPTGDGWILDDRLADVSALADGDVVTAVVRGTDRLAVVP